MQYNSELSGIIHEMAAGLHEAGAIDKTTMRGFDKSCLSKVEQLSPEAVCSNQERETGGS